MRKVGYLKILLTTEYQKMLMVEYRKMLKVEYQKVTAYHQCAGNLGTQGTHGRLEEISKVPQTMMNRALQYDHLFGKLWSSSGVVAQLCFVWSSNSQAR